MKSCTDVSDNSMLVIYDGVIFYVGDRVNVLLTFTDDFSDLVTNLGLCLGLCYGCVPIRLLS